MPKKSETPATGGRQDITSVVVSNLVELQKVHVSLIEKFDRLSRQMSELLTLFENAARSFAQHPANQASDKDKEFLDKIDRLLDQNKTIAKGLTMMEDRMKERIYGQDNTREEEAPIATKPLPKF